MLDISVDSLDFDEIRLRDENGMEVTYSMREELKINDYNMYEEFKLQPSKYVYWSSLLEKVRGYLEAAQLNEEKVRAELHEPGRQYNIQLGSAKPTKDQIESFIIQQERYQIAREQVMVYTKYVKQLQYIVKALEQRKDMLLQIGAEKRREKDYEQAIKNM